MQGKILLGSPQAQEAYISSLITEYKINAYSITRIEGTIKIEDVKHLTYSSRVHAGNNEKRLVILSGSLTIPAQNALLKYLEELPESDFVLFLVPTADTLLETIQSRCHSVFLGYDCSNQIESRAPYLEELVSNPNISGSALSLAQTINTPQEYDQLVRELRRVIVERVIQDRILPSPQQIGFLRYLFEQNQYVQQNNVNPKFTVEMFINN